MPLQPHEEGCAVGAPHTGPCRDEKNQELPYALIAHHKLCASDPHHLGPCYDKDGHRLPGRATEPRPRPQDGIVTTRLDVATPAVEEVTETAAERAERHALDRPLIDAFDQLRGPQPVTPGPLHAVVRGPGGLDITLSGEPGVFGRLLEAIGDAISASLGD